MKARRLSSPPGKEGACSIIIKISSSSSGSCADTDTAPTNKQQRTNNHFFIKFVRLTRLNHDKFRNFYKIFPTFAANNYKHSNATIMMQYWHECRIKYETQDEQGKLKRVSEAYLVDAMTYTEVEARILKEQGNNMSGEYVISNIKRVRLAEVLPDPVNEDDPWFTLRYSMISVDEVSGKEKKKNYSSVIQANSCEKAIKRFDEYMNGSVSDYDILAVSRSVIVSCYKMQTDEQITRAIESEQPQA